jgi:hypothetical protein
MVTIVIERKSVVFEIGAEAEETVDHPAYNTT